MAKLIEQDKDHSKWRINYEANNARVCGKCMHWLGDSNTTRTGQCTKTLPTKKNPETQLDEDFDGKTFRSFSCRTQFEENKNLHFENGSYYYKNLTK
jgi:hypothetical protein